MLLEIQDLPLCLKLHCPHHYTSPNFGRSPTLWLRSLLHMFYTLYQQSSWTKGKLLFPFCLQPDELTNALEISNIVFTSLFSLEMLLKVLVYGPFGYIKNPYNIFDGVIVVIRWAKIFWHYRTWRFSTSSMPRLHAETFSLTMCVFVCRWKIIKWKS